MDDADARGKGPRPPAAMITAGVSIIGDVECASDLQIAGRVQGDVRCSTVFIDEGGTVTGGIYADRVRVSGTVDGTIEAGDLAVEQGARVSGSIAYTRLKVSAGGVVEGSFKHRAGDAGAAASGGAASGGAATDSSLKLVDAGEPANPRRVYVD